MNSLNLLCVARCLIQKDHETNSNSRCSTVIHLNLFFTGFVLEIQLKKFWFGRCCCVVLLENIYVSSLLLIFSAKWRCPSIDCLLENFFIRIWLENSFGKILCPLIRGVHLSEFRANWRFYCISKETSVTCNKFESFKEILLRKYPWICFNHAFQVFDIDRSYSNVWSYGKIIANNLVDFIAKKKNCALNVS